MYFLTYASKGSVAFGVLSADKTAVMPLVQAEQQVLHTSSLPATMLEFIEQGPSALDTVAKLIAKEDDCPKLLLADIKIMATIPHPRKNIFCIGKNYAEHAMEFDKTKDASVAVPKVPVIFTKPPTTVIGPGDAVNSHPLVTKELDYEVELAVVIGRKGTYIPKEQAFDYVFGYTVMNDVTARDLQKLHLQWHRGKSLDTFAPMGPYLVHKSAVANPENLPISLKVNGEIRQNANTNDFVFKIADLIATISFGVTLEPGDIIATGTPSGVGAAMNPPRFLQKGDEMELEIGGIGILKNTVG